MKRFDVVGFGALNVDKLFKVDKLVEGEGESFITEYHESCGGSAANTIVGLARLGLKTGCVGTVSDDRGGQLLLDDFRREHVNTEGIATAKGGQSGVVIDFVDKEGQRALYVAPGVNDTIDSKEIASDYVGRTKLLHVTSFVGEKSFESQRRLLEQLSPHIKVSFDPGMLYAKTGVTKLTPITRRAFAMMPNEAELKLLTDMGYAEGAKKLLAQGVEIVAVKLGGKGCFVTNGEESHLVKPFGVKVVDTTGAGDAWNAGFLYGLLKNKGLQECGKLGNLVASRCITKMGARTGLPRLADLPS
jgi:ribokinase